MRKTIVAVMAFVAIALAPAQASAWGVAGHRLIMRHAIALLPPSEYGAALEKCGAQPVRHVQDVRPVQKVRSPR